MLSAQIVGMLGCTLWSAVDQTPIMGSLAQRESDLVLIDPLRESKREASCTGVLPRSKCVEWNKCTHVAAPAPVRVATYVYTWLQRKSCNIYLAVKVAAMMTCLPLYSRLCDISSEVKFNSTTRRASIEQNWLLEVVDNENSGGHLSQLLCWQCHNVSLQCNLYSVSWLTSA